MQVSGPRLGYVLKRYPRYSETFVVTEILAHERAGTEVEVFALRQPTDTHFQDLISRVKAPVTYLFPPDEGIKAAHFWQVLERAAAAIPGLWARVAACEGEDAREVYQAALLARLVRERQITHLHAHFATSATAVARMASELSCVPFTFTAHAKDIFHDDVDPLDLERKMSAAAAVVTVSEFNLAYLTGRLPGAASRVRRVYNGLDLSGFVYAPPDAREPLVVGVGRLVEKKGFSDLVDACGLLARGGRRFRCQIVGSGELRADLDAHIARQNLSSVVELVGPKPQREVIDLVRQASALAAPCIVGADGNRDGLPTVLLEAMAVGTPCVSTDVTGIPEVLRDGDTGLLVPQHDAAALARAIARLLDDAVLRTQLAARARTLIETDFDTDRNAARLRSLMGVGLSGPSRAAAMVGA